MHLRFPLTQKCHKAQFWIWIINSKITFKNGSRFDNDLFLKLQNSGVFTYADRGDPNVILSSDICVKMEETIIEGHMHEHGLFVFLCSICYV